ncbi:MAG TPA: MFS transporter [Candidatus Paceibacterota bacterium]|nr:MFS transporter [Candidatus Paceibacterota bacterium]
MTGINKVIKTLIVSDFLLQSGWGLIGPIFAIFITQQIAGGNLASVGFIAATYWFVKSIAQPFIAHFLDVKKGEKDDFKLLVFGMFCANLVPLAYIFATELWHIFLMEAIRGLAMACVIPTWAGIFTRHIDKGWEAFSWSIESTSLGFAAAFAGGLGATLATFFGFKIVFILISVFGIGATLLLFLIRNHLFHRDGFVPRVPPTEKPF